MNAMNMNEMEGLWNSPRNNFSPQAVQSLVDQFSRRMRRRRRFQAIWLIHTFVALTVITLIALSAIATGKTRLEREWALLPLLIVPWLFSFHFLRRYLNPSPKVARGESSVVESLRAALASNRAEQSRLKAVAALF